MSNRPVAPPANSATRAPGNNASSNNASSNNASGNNASGNNQPASARTHAAASAEPEVRLVNRVLPGDVKLFAPEGSAEGCASGECLPPPPAGPPEPPIDLHDADEPEPPAPVVAQPARTAAATDDERWRRAVDAVREAAPRHGKSLSYARFLGMTPEGVKIAFPPDAAFHRSQVIGMSRTMVETELTRALGRPIKLVEETNAAALQTAPKSIAELEATDRSSRERGISDKVRAHPAVRNVIRHLGGSLEHIAYLEPVARPTAAPATPSDEGDAGPPVD